MKDNKQRRKNKMFVLNGGLIFIATVSMFVLFAYCSERLHNMILEKEMEQSRLVSNYVTKIVQAEIEDCVEILETSAAFLSSNPGATHEEIVENLRKVKEHSVFHLVGIRTLDGHSINSEGERRLYGESKLKKAIEQNQYYISATLLDGTHEDGKIVLAVPIHEDGKVTGALWGRYPISSVSEKIDSAGDIERYFQIVDNDGKYIYRSENVHAFAKGDDLWEELKNYSYPEGESLKEIRDTVENHGKGTFYFQHQGERRYVAYEPLGINNWYVLSVLTGDSLEEYVAQIREISMNALMGFTLFLIAVFGVIWAVSLQGKKEIEEKNHQLAIRTQLFRMIMKKTKDIPFELNIKEKWVKIYQPSSADSDYEIMYDFSPDKMRKEHKIREKDYQKYCCLYEEMMSGKEVEPIAFEMNLEGNLNWNWYRIHLLRLGTESGVGFLEDYTEQISQNKKLKEISQKNQYDILTGLYHRAAFTAKVEHALSMYEEGGEKSALFLLDLDCFKEINDTLGHVVGDQVLRETGLLLKSVIRSTDIAGRLGGDEFVVFIQDAADLYGVRRCAEKLNHVLSRTYEKDGKTGKVSASIGIAVVKEGMTFKELYEKADIALYEVKKNNRNGYRIAEEQEEETGEGE